MDQIDIDNHNQESESIFQKILSFIKNQKMTIILIINLVIFNVSFKISLFPCPYESFADCNKYLFDILYLIVIFIVLSVSSLLFVLIYSIQKKKYLFLFLGLLNITLYHIIYWNEIDNLEYHINYNLKVVTLFTVAIYATFLFVKISIFSITKRIRYLYLQYLFIFLLLSTYAIMRLLDISDWKNGYKSSIMDNNLGCKVRLPVFNTFNLLNNVFDKTKFLELNCENNFSFNKNYYFTLFDNSDIVFMKGIKNKSNKERAKSYEINLLNENKIFVNFLVKGKERNNFSGDNVISYNKNEIINYYLSKGNEVYIDFTDLDQPKAYQKVYFNQTLANERKKIYNQKVNSDSSGNVLYLFIDAISRRNIFKKLPKVISFFENYYNNTESEFESFQFFKYNPIRDFTYYDMAGIYFGRDIRNLINKAKDKDISKEVRKSIYDIYRERGYLINLSTTLCEPLVFGYDPEDSNFLFPQNSTGPHDHENLNLICDPNILNPDLALTQETIRCLYNRRTSKLSLEYADQLINTYKDYNQFLSIYLMDAHEATGEVVKYTEDDLIQFLMKNKQTFIDKNWSIILASDHGLQLSPTSHIPFTDAFEERLLPFLTVLLPRNTANKYRDNIKTYENHLITNFDIHNILKYLSGEKNVPTEMTNTLTIFNDTVKDRSCLEMNITEDNCRCF